MSNDAKRVGQLASQLESFVIKQLLQSSGAFKGSGVAGSALTQSMFADTLAEAVAASGGMGLSSLIEKSLPSSSPVMGGVVSSGFGFRADPWTGEQQHHNGIDIAAAEGSPIVAAKEGVVIAAGERGGYGNAVEIAHSDGTSALYAHASEVTVTQGQHVSAGEIVAHVGQTGRTTGPHLHFELRRGGQSIDPGSALKVYRLRAEELNGGEQ